MGEGDRGLVVNVTKNAATEIRYQFSVIATDINTTAPDDYSAGDEPRFFIEPEAQQFEIHVTITDDAEIEPVETFQLELFVAEQPHFRLGNITGVTVTIIDNDECEDEEKEWRKRENEKRKGVKEDGE